MNSNLQTAKEMMENDGFTCVIMNDEIAHVSMDSGIKPLIDFIADGLELKGYSAADKIVGKAAAFLYVKMQVSEVYASVLSVEGKKLLDENGIAVEYGTLTEQIINRKGTGMCPMEETVKDIDDIEEAYRALNEKCKAMAKRKEGLLS